jgi:hypothetical protein
MAGAGRHIFGSNPQQDRPSVPQPARDAKLGGWPAWSPCWPGDNDPHAITSVRRRRRDVAIFMALGFGSGQVSKTVAWPATTLGLVARANRPAPRHRGRPLGPAAPGRVAQGGRRSGRAAPARAGDRSASPTATPQATTRGAGPGPSRPRSPTHRCCTATAPAGVTAADAPVTGCGACPRPGRWPSCAPGRLASSQRQASRSTPGWSWRRPSSRAPVWPAGKASAEPGPVISPAARARSTAAKRSSAATGSIR